MEESSRKHKSTVVNCLIVLGVFLIVFSVWAYIESNRVKGQIKSISENLCKLNYISTSKDEIGIQKEILNMQFKEDFYLTQLNNSVTIILGSIGFVLALGGFLSYKNIDDKLNSFERGHDSHKKQLDKTLFKLEEKFIEITNQLKKDFNKDIEDMNVKIFNVEKENNDLKIEINLFSFFAFKSEIQADLDIIRYIEISCRAIESMCLYYKSKQKMNKSYYSSLNERRLLQVIVALHNRIMKESTDSKTLSIPTLTNEFLNDTLFSVIELELQSKDMVDDLMKKINSRTSN